MKHKLYMMIGLPASGKSTIAKELSKNEGAVIVSTDKIREELSGDENNQDKNKSVFVLIEERIAKELKHKDVIYDATNIDYKRRRTFLKKFNNVEKIAMLVITPFEDCLKRNEQRERKVPEHVIREMYYNLYIPQKYEGFDKVNIIYNIDPEENKYLIADLLEEIDIPQDNPHHTLSIEKHCLKAYAYIVEHNPNDEILGYAALLHDVGKKETKTFTNKRGEKTEIAHYYGHQFVSAYMSLYYLKDMEKEKRLQIANLIQWHMLVDFKLLNSTKEKYKNLLGEETWNKLQILHAADVSAK